MTTATRMRGVAGRVAPMAAYALVSAVALAVDVAVMLALIGGGLAAAGAAVAGYIVGLGVHWALSSRLLFRNAVICHRSAAGRRQRALFIGSALAGLGATGLIVGAGDALGVPALLAKGVAVALSFQLTYWLRCRFVFGLADADARA